MGRLMFIAVALLTGGAAFSLTLVLWPLPPGMVLPPENLIPFFAFMIAAESFSFGLGIAFLIFGFPLVRRLAASRLAAWGGYLGIAWLFMNWWPHESFHRTTLSTQFTRMIWIQYGFHLTLILAAGLVAYFFAEVARGRVVGGALGDRSSPASSHGLEPVKGTRP